MQEDRDIKNEDCESGWVRVRIEFVRWCSLVGGNTMKGKNENQDDGFSVDCFIPSPEAGFDESVLTD